MPERIRFGIVSNSSLERESVGNAIASVNARVDFQFSCSLAQAVAKTRQNQPHQLLVCAGESYLVAYELVQSIRAECPNVSIIAIVNSIHSPASVDVLLAGAKAVFSCEQGLAEFVELMLNVSAEQLVHPPEITAQVLDRLSQTRQRQARLPIEAEVLTAREREILDLVASRHTNKEIAKKLFLSLHTIKNHIHRIIEKLHVTSRTEAALYLMSHHGHLPSGKQPSPSKSNQDRRQRGELVVSTQNPGDYRAPEHLACP